MILDRDECGNPKCGQKSPGRPRKHTAPREASGRVQRASKANPGERLSVYVMCLPDNGGCKIGYSVDPKKRVAGIQVSNHLPVRLFWVLDLDADMARRVEHHVHKQLRLTLNHLRGEWYAMAPMTAVEVVRSVAKSLTGLAKSS